MTSPDEHTSSTIIVAIGELARMGHADEALKQVEYIHQLLPNDDAQARSRLMMTGAEIAFEAGNLERMEEYLQRELQLQPLFTRKCDRGCQEASVRRFRIHHSLIAPQDIPDAEESIKASFWWLIREASKALDRGDAATSTAKLIEAEGFLDSISDALRRHASEALVKGFARAEDNRNLQRLLDRDASADRFARISSRTLLAIGQRTRGIARIEVEAAEALSELKTNTMNAHFPAMLLEMAIRHLADAGEMELAKNLLGRALEEGSSWNLAAPGAFKSSVFKSMAKAVARVQGPDAALAMIKLAVETASGDKKSDWRTTAIHENTDLLIEFSPPEDAVKLASKIRSPQSKQKMLAKIFAQRQDWDQLHEVLNQCAKPLDAAELIWWTKFVWRPAQ